MKTLPGTQPWERREFFMNNLLCLMLLVCATTSMVGQGASDRNLSHKRLRMDVTTAPTPARLLFPSEYRLQNLALQKAEQATARAAAPNVRGAATEKYPLGKVRPTRNVETSGQMLVASSTLKLSKGAGKNHVPGRHKGWLTTNLR
jgi:hypothetical protein